MPLLANRVDAMKPKCKLQKTWSAIKPKGCKVHPKHHKPSSSSNASAHSQARSESIIQRPAAKKPAVRRITPIAISSAPSSQSSMTASSLTSSHSEFPSQNSSKKRIDAIVERRIKSHNRQPSFKKGFETIRCRTKIFGRS